MSSLVTETTVNTILDTHYAVLSVKFGLIAIMLLISLLVIREIARIFYEEKQEVWMKTLDVVIAPLFITLMIILFTRGLVYITVI